jgi:hypothetical protein
MGIFEYVSVLTSIIIGLGITHLLRGVARLIQHPGRVKTYWVHLLWVVNTFLTAISWWWWEFHLAAQESWTFEMYLFVVFFAVLLFVLCALLFPSDLEDYSGFEDYFLSRRQWFFGCSALTYLVDLADTWLKGADHFASFGIEYPIGSGVEFILCVIAMVTKNKRFHGGFVLLSLLYFLSWSTRTFATFG